MKIRKILGKLKKVLTRMFRRNPHQKFIYGICWRFFPVRKKTVLVESFHGKTVGDSGVEFVREIQRLYPGKYRIWYASASPKEHRAFCAENGLAVRIISVETLRYTRILATAGYIISNASLPIYFIRRPEQTYLQTWHGTPLKTLGKKMRMGIESMYNVQHNFLQASYITQPNEFTKKVIMEDYNLESLYTGKVVMAGYPRNRIFFDTEAGKALREKLGLAGKTVYAYMPTWRGSSNHEIDNTGFVTDLENLFRKLDGSLGEDQLLYVNLHPIMSGSVSYDKYKRIRPFPKSLGTYDFLNCVDALVTDYSSVFFDFSLTKKPVVLFMYDYEQYMKERGMYFDVRTLPFRQIYDADELAECLRSGACLADDYGDTEYFRTFFKYDAPDNTERLLGLLFTGEDSGFTIYDYGKNRELPRKVFLPPPVKEKSDFETLSKAASGKDAIVLLYKKWFRPGISELLHDGYNDDFTYVITTNTPPRTYLEEFFSRIGLRAAQDAVHKRDIRRCFADLPVDPEYVRDVGALRMGCRAALSDTDMMPAEYEGMEDARVPIRYQLPEGVTPLQAVLCRGKRVIVSMRDLTEEEKESGRAVFDLRPHVEDLTLCQGDGGQPGLLCTDTKGQEKLWFFTMRDKFDSAAARHGGDYGISYYYEPCRISFSLPRDYERMDLKKTDLRESAKTDSRFDRTPEDRTLAIHCRLDKNGLFRFAVTKPEEVLQRALKGILFRSVSCGKHSFTVRVSVPGWKSDEIEGAYIKLRSKTKDLSIPLSAAAKDTRKGSSLTLRGTFDGTSGLRSIYWDLFVLLRYEGEPCPIPVTGIGFMKKVLFSLRNMQLEPEEGWILFPFATKAGKLAFMYREKTPYDTMAFRMKEFLATCLAGLAYPVLYRRKIWMIYEKFSRTAQDNSFYFFKYCMEQLPEKDRKRIFYVIDKNAGDYRFVQPYDRNVIQFLSLKHLIYGMTMRICVATDAKSHFYLWRSKMSMVTWLINRKPEFFLQHGVTALKKVDPLYGVKGSSPMTYFTATSKIEQDIVVQNFGYERERVPITGFTRWDVLEDKQDRNDRFILLMPTWRSWLEEVSDDVFTGSDYFREYTSFIGSPALRELLEKNDVRLIFYLHPKFAPYMQNFQALSEGRIECIEMGQQPLNELMMRCAMLITDYSSVCWDVLYMDKPVIFFQFDADRYLTEHGAYIDFARDLPGDRVTDRDGLMKALENAAAEDFRIGEAYREKAEQYFAYKDNDNSKRTAAYLKGQGY